MTFMFGAVARISMLVWVRDLASLFHTSTKAVIAGVTMAFLGAAGLGLLLAAVTVQAPAGPYPAELKELMLRTALSSSAVIGLLVIVVLAVSLPPRTSLQSLMDLLPVSRLAAQVGQLVPVLGLAAVFGLALSAIAVAVAHRVLEPLAFAAACLAVVGNLVALQMLALGAFLALSSLLRRRLRIPHEYAVTVAGAFVLIAALGTFARDVFTFGDNVRLPTAQGWSLQDLLVTRLAVQAVVHGGVAELLGIALWWAAGCLALLGACRLGHDGGTTGGLRLLTGTRPPKGQFLSAAWFEVLIAARTPQFIVTALSAVPLVMGVRWLATIDLMTATAEQLASALPAVPFALSMYGVGRTVKYRWLGSVLEGSWSWWIAPKVIAYTLVGAAIAIPTFAIEVALGMVGVDRLPAVIARIVVVLAAGLLGGTLAPYSEEQGLSVAASGFLTGLLVIAASMFASWAGSGTSSQWGLLAELCVAGGFLALYALIASGQARDATRYV